MSERIVGMSQDQGQSKNQQLSGSLLLMAQNASAPSKLFFSNFIAFALH
jgi:hypothetical protein